MSKLLGKWIANREINTNHILLANDQFMLGRNSINTLDLNLFKVDTNDELLFGIQPSYSSLPTQSQHLANKDYVDQTVFGIRDPKDACRVASTANVNIASAPASIDGVTLASGDRVLLKNQSTASENGIYVFNGTGSAMTRSNDADNTPAGEVTQGMSTLIIEGTVNAHRTYALTTADPITLGVTNLSFAQVPSLGNLLVFKSIVVTLVAGDITNGYIDLAHEAVSETVELTPKGGPEQEFGVDYTLSVPVSVTRISFGGDLASTASAGDKLLIHYTYQP